jgi:hypothetical protein
MNLRSSWMIIWVSSDRILPDSSVTPSRVAAKSVWSVPRVFLSCTTSVSWGSFWVLQKQHHFASKMQFPLCGSFLLVKVKHKEHTLVHLCWHSEVGTSMSIIALRGNANRCAEVGHWVHKNDEIEFKSPRAAVLIRLTRSKEHTSICVAPNPSSDTLSRSRRQFCISRISWDYLSLCNPFEHTSSLQTRHLHSFGSPYFLRKRLLREWASVEILQSSTVGHTNTSWVGARETMKHRMCAFHWASSFGTVDLENLTVWPCRRGLQEGLPNALVLCSS